MRKHNLMFKVVHAFVGTKYVSVIGLLSKVAYRNLKYEILMELMLSNFLIIFCFRELLSGDLIDTLIKEKLK